MSMWGSRRTPAHRGHGSAVIPHLSISAFILFYDVFFFFSSETTANKRKKKRGAPCAHRNMD